MWVYYGMCGCIKNYKDIVLAGKKFTFTHISLYLSLSLSLSVSTLIKRVHDEIKGGLLERRAQLLQSLRNVYFKAYLCQNIT